MTEVILKAILGLLALVIGATSIIIYKGKQDNPVEEVAEMIIEETVGIDIDLTPTSPEK